MRSLIILEVEHGETTGPLENIIATVESEIPHLSAAFNGVELKNYTVRVDVPACFVLDKPVFPVNAAFVAAGRGWDGTK